MPASGDSQSSGESAALLLADEPTGNLDKENSQSLLDLLKEINMQGCSILMATHNVDLLAALPYRKFYLENGAISENVK